MLVSSSLLRPSSNAFLLSLDCFLLPPPLRLLPRRLLPFLLSLDCFREKLGRGVADGRGAAFYYLLIASLRQRHGVQGGRRVPFYYLLIASILDNAIDGIPALIPLSTIS